jgi:hypothetical protein
MPRRISDYPDAFAGWNLISSFGSIISVVATWLFLYIVYIQLVEGKTSTRYPWLTPQFYSDTLRILLNRSYNSLEWALNSPPKPHAFVSLPLQSKITIKSFTKHLILINVLTGIIIFIAFFFFRNFIFPEACYIINFIILEDISIEFYINKDLFLGILAVISRFSLKGFVEDFLEVFLQPKLTIGDISSTLLMNTDQFTKEGDGSDKSTGLRDNSKMEQKVIDSIFTDSIKLEFNKFKEDMAKLAKSLKDRRMMYDQGKLTLDNPEVPNLLVMMLQDQTQFLNASILKRIEWLKVTRPSLPLLVREELSTIEKNIYGLQSNLRENITKIPNIQDEKQQVKEFFDIINAYRNKVRKEIIRLETVSHDGFKKNLPDLYKLKEFKQLVNIDAPKVIKEVVDEDGYLKSKISEIINAKKK